MGPHHQNLFVPVYQSTHHLFTAAKYDTILAVLEKKIRENNEIRVKELIQNIFSSEDFHLTFVMVDSTI